MVVKFSMLWFFPSISPKIPLFWLGSRLMSVYCETLHSSISFANDSKILILGV